MPENKTSVTTLTTRNNQVVQRAGEVLSRYYAGQQRQIQSPLRQGSIAPRSGLLERGRDLVLNTEPGRRLGQVMDFINNAGAADVSNMAPSAAVSAVARYRAADPRRISVNRLLKLRDMAKAEDAKALAKSPLLKAGAREVTAAEAGTGAFFIDDAGGVYRLPIDDHAVMLDKAGLAKGGEAYSPYGLSKNKLARLRVNPSSIAMQIAHAPTGAQRAAIQEMLRARPGSTVTYETLRRNGIQGSIEEALTAID